MAEFLERIGRKEPVDIGDAAVEIIREHRGPLP